jgi:hypothetical protein
VVSAFLCASQPSTPSDDDLSAVVLLSHALSMRLPLGAPISHAEALQHCKELAAKLLQRSTEPQALPPGAPPITPLTCACMCCAGLADNPAVYEYVVVVGCRARLHGSLPCAILQHSIHALAAVLSVLF